MLREAKKIIVSSERVPPWVILAVNLARQRRKSVPRNERFYKFYLFLELCHTAWCPAGVPCVHHASSLADKFKKTISKGLKRLKKLSKGAPGCKTNLFLLNCIAFCLYSRGEARLNSKLRLHSWVLYKGNRSAGVRSSARLHLPLSFLARGR